MKDLIDMNIKFDFFINLSFACLPVKETVNFVPPILPTSPVKKLSFRGKP